MICYVFRYTWSIRLTTPPSTANFCITWHKMEWKNTYWMPFEQWRWCQRLLLPNLPSFQPLVRQGRRSTCFSPPPPKLLWLPRANNLRQTCSLVDSTNDNISQPKDYVMRLGTRHPSARQERKVEKWTTQITIMQLFLQAVSFERFEIDSSFRHSGSHCSLLHFRWHADPLCKRWRIANGWFRIYIWRRLLLPCGV